MFVCSILLFLSRRKLLRRWMADPWCWLVTWIHHPQYPRIPDSLLYYATTPFGPNHANASYARSRVSAKGGILVIRPTLDGY